MYEQFSQAFLCKDDMRMIHIFIVATDWLDVWGHVYVQNTNSDKPVVIPLKEAYCGHYWLLASGY